MENFSISPTEEQIITFKNGMSLRRVSTINIKIPFVKRYLCNAKIVLLQRDILSNSYFRYLLDKTLKRDEENIGWKKVHTKNFDKQSSSFDNFSIVHSCKNPLIIMTPMNAKDR